MAEKRRSFLQHIFGDDIGEMLAVLLIMPVMMLGFVGVPQFISKMSQKDPQAELLAKLPKDSQELVQELAAVQLKTQNLVKKLESDTSNAEALLKEKQKALEELQKKIALLQLTPEQRAVVEQYNLSVSGDSDFGQWVSRKTTWYEAGIATLISWFFYWLGLRRGRKHANAFEQISEQ